MAGAAILVLSGLVDVVNSTDLTPDKGSAVVAALTDLGYLAGTLIVLVGVIAKGVSVGIAMSREDAS